jgi:hypothetical protein
LTVFGGRKTPAPERRELSVVPDCCTRKQLIAFVVDSLTERDDKEKLHNILEFEGVAAHQADDEDPQAYVDRLRSEWDDRP